MFFEEGNGITVHFDFQFYYENIPHDVDFSVKKWGEGYRLKGRGYGLESDYGSGALTTYIHEMTDEQKRLFE